MTLLITEYPHEDVELGQPEIREEEEEVEESPTISSKLSAGLKGKLVKFILIAFIAIGVITGLVLFIRYASSSSNTSSGKKTTKSGGYEDSNLIKDDGDHLSPNQEHTYAERIKQESLVTGKISVTWSDIVGQTQAKSALIQSVVWPLARPTLFKGPRSASKGVLLFGPPGTGKTMLAKAVATAIGANFFNVSASTFAAKYYGEAERLMRALFELARQNQPAVIFMDEVDAILRNRSDSDHEASRRVKTEFLVQTDGLMVDPDVRLLVLAATNRPMDIDEAALRRFEKRIKVDLPNQSNRAELLQKGIAGLTTNMRVPEDFQELSASMSENFYSGSDLTYICRAAAMRPVLDVANQITTIREEEIRPITRDDFQEAIRGTRRTVSPESLQELERWEQTYGAN